MNRMKEAFDEQFGDLLTGEDNVKRGVMRHVQQGKRPRKWQIPAAVSLLLVAIVSFLATQITKPPEQTAVLDDHYFEITLYSQYYLSNAFGTEKQMSKIVYENMLMSAAYTEYAAHLGLGVDVQQLEDMTTQQYELLEELMSSEEAPWVRFTYTSLFKQFDLTLESFIELQKENSFLPTVSHTALREHYGDNQDEQIEQDALNYIEEQYASELQRFKDKHGIDETYEVNRVGEASELVTVNGTYETVIVNGVEVFEDSFWSVDHIFFDYEDIMKKIEESEEVAMFYYATLDQYAAGAQKLTDHQEYGQQAKDLLRVIEVLKNSVELN